MEILNKPISEMTFEKVIEFCQEGHQEGIQIDYKRDLPNDLAKHFASFSNTRGGVIIVGIEENRDSGVPEKWEGIEKNAKQIEKIHQIAGNVEPLPAYDVHITNEVEGKCFLLIRIYEGDNTPYYVQNDSNVWVRTGNVSKPISIASPDGLELMFGKKEKAAKARDLALKTAEEVYSLALERAEGKRVKLIEDAKRKDAQRTDGQETVTRYYQKKLGTDALMCRIAILPYSPKESLATPKEIRDGLGDICFRNRGYGNFPSLNAEPIPQGILSFLTRYEDGYIECQQVYGNGLIFHHLDVLTVDKDGLKIVPLWRIAGQLFVFIKFAKSFFEKFGYQGSLEGFISLENMADVLVKQIEPPRYILHNDNKKSFLKEYRIKIKIDTNILKSSEGLKEYYYGLVREIYWALGYDDVSDAIINDFLEHNGFTF